MKPSRKPLKKGGYTGTQRSIIRFRASDALHERLKFLAAQEEMCLGTFVRRLVLDNLKKFPD